MDDETRRRFALLVLAVSSAALIATSPPLGTTVEVDGEIVVGPARPGTLAARFEVGPRAGLTLESGRLTIRVPRDQSEPRLATEFSVQADGTAATESGGGFDIPTETCLGGCTVDLRATVSWVGPPEADLSVRWSASLNVVGAGYSQVPVSASVIEGRRPDLPALGWLGIGGLLAAATGVGWMVAGRRFRWLRLAVAAGGVVVAGVPALQLAGAALAFGRIDGAWISSGLLSVAAPFGLVAIGIAFALWAHLRGKVAYLPILGWLYLVLIGADLAITTEASSTYRPQELVILGFVSGAPAAAAITSARLVPRKAESRTTQGTILVAASQILLLVVYGFGALIGMPAAMLSLSMAGGEGRPATLLAAVLVVIFVLLVLGFRAWLAGRRALLVAANALALPPLLLLIVGGAVTGSLFRGLAPLFLLPGALLTGAALVGILGGVLVDPPGQTGVSTAPPVREPAPPADRDGDQQGGKGQQVGRVEDEADGLGNGDSG